ncbi:MAG: AbrB/MazE/SpoVT family DNA-binding domain-containing protein [Verrucomicrobia bacterium]|nr:AbrB/MazE/SpoVT family DNA-binding domain-containing protein [Verrucomicrobiota bacterium]
MKTSLIAIGNSHVIRIPETLIEQCGLQNEVELDVRDNAIIIHSLKPARLGWDKAFARMNRLGDDAMLHEDSKASKWDTEEWK